MPDEIAKKWDFKHMSRAEADQAWKDTLARVQLYAAPTRSDDRIAAILRIISFLPKDIRNIVLTASSIYIGFIPYTEEDLKKFIDRFSEKALNELRESSSTLVKWPDGRQSIFIHILDELGAGAMLVFLRQVARLALGFSGYSTKTPEIQPALEQSVLELAVILNEYVKVEVISYREGQDGCEA